MEDEIFYVIVKREEGRVVGHSIKSGDIDKDFVENVFASKEKDVESTKISNEVAEGESIDKHLSQKSFLEVERSFSRAMMMYRNSVVRTIKLAPVVASVSLGRGIEEIVKNRGEKLPELSSDTVEVYSLPKHAVHTVNQYSEKAEALIQGAAHLPTISTIGIISSYDAILSDLLRVVFTIKPEIIFTSDREIKFSDLVGFETISDARESIVGNEIESVMRQSHHEQFSWMERKFSMKLREGLDVWPDFIELCERRNLLTHTGGVISEQYIKNCSAGGKKQNGKLGEKLVVDLDYLTKSIDIVSEVGYKLIHTFWRKFCPNDREEADGALNEIGVKLIEAKQYGLAEKILEFGVKQKQHSSDLIRRMMIVNLANSAKLNGDKNKCDRGLSSCDWSAASYQFQISVAAVKNDFPEVKRLLLLGGDVVGINPSAFRDWPVFHDARKDLEVKKAFEEVFGEPLIKNEDVTSHSSPAREDLADEEGADSTIVH